MFINDKKNVYSYNLKNIKNKDMVIFFLLLIALQN